MTKERETLIREKLKEAYEFFGKTGDDCLRRVEHRMEDIFYETQKTILLDGVECAGYELPIAVGSECSEKCSEIEIVKVVELFVTDNNMEYILEQFECIMQDEEPLFGEHTYERIELDKVKDLNTHFHVMLI